MDLVTRREIKTLSVSQPEAFLIRSRYSVGSNQSADQSEPEPLLVLLRWRMNREKTRRRQSSSRRRSSFFLVGFCHFNCISGTDDVWVCVVYPEVDPLLASSSACNCSAVPLGAAELSPGSGFCFQSFNPVLITNRLDIWKDSNVKENITKKKPLL